MIFKRNSWLNIYQCDISLSFIRFLKGADFSTIKLNDQLALENESKLWAQLVSAPWYICHKN